LYSSTAGPSFTTVPIYSWPKVKFLLNGRPPPTEAGTPWLTISRSVAQTAQASMRTSTSADLGSGTGFSTSFTSSGLPSTQAFILAGMSYSFAPCSAAMAYASKLRCWPRV
jgi:hypothetical protein